MDFDKKIRNLLSENEFLQSQLEDLNDLVRQKDEEIHILGDDMDTAASLQSRIENNLLEIQQLTFNNSETERKAESVEQLNEQLENELLKVMREHQRDEKQLQEMSSVKASLNVANLELEETAVLYKRLQQMKAELSEVRSNAEMLQIENDDLKTEVAELKALLDHIKIKPPQLPGK